MRDPDVVKWFFRESSDQGSLTLYRIKIWHKIPNGYNCEPLTSKIVIFFFDINSQNSEYEIYKDEWTTPEAEDIKNAVKFIESRMKNSSLVVDEDDEIVSEVSDGKINNQYLHAMYVFIRHQKEKYCVRRLQNELNQNPALIIYAPLLLDIVLALKEVESYPSNHARTVSKIILISLKQAIEMLAQKIRTLWGIEDEDEVI